LTLHQDDADVRAEALRTAVSALETDPALLAAVVDELDTVDDGALHTLLGAAAGEHAEEIAMQILTQARANELRVKASSILQRRPRSLLARFRRAALCVSPAARRRS